MRKKCTYPNCDNKGKRVGHRKYSDRCHLHQRQYFAQQIVNLNKEIRKSFQEINRGSKGDQE